MNSRKSPNEVFTPRSRDINERMYVDRPLLEQRLVDALKGDKYVIVHGESGNGKTWLYKRVLAREGVGFEVVNLANAVFSGSFWQGHLSQSFMSSDSKTSPNER
jgi:hypothetical protein